nr:MAG TPA: hypothetical protein [Bacteriophage sp.]
MKRGWSPLVALVSHNVFFDNPFPRDYPRTLCPCFSIVFIFLLESHLD